MEATQASIHRCMDKQNVVYLYDGILFSLKREGNSDTWMNVEDIMVREISQSQKDKHCMIPLT